MVADRDRAPVVELEGAVQAVRDSAEDAEVILVGEESRLQMAGAPELPTVDRSVVIGEDAFVAAGEIERRLPSMRLQSAHATYLPMSGKTH